ncbi:lytic transglycosylase domain-containing protein [Candidatus Marithrix sp. Canyon 246]|uniref:lytic transglycosylase domain-containing protein n=1 Tax=Candidatus Marithrix sp. Canyon 246 TaxID=1827136 RepID=UPI000849F69B|nr:lytic transglycosylase domain-containing protein [Candidatus Marithrix sp. Canyon 246]
MKKILFSLLIGLYFLSILSCSTTPQIEDETSNKDSDSTSDNDTTTPDYIRTLFPSTTPKPEDDFHNQNGNSTHKPVKQTKQQNQSSASVPEYPPINNKRITILKLVKKAARRYNVKQSLVCAIINQESRWKPRAVSHAGAVGLMQIMPATGRSACDLSRKELFNPSKNINCGVYYFNEQFKRFNSIKRALCAYNAGPHRIVKYGKCPPFKETQHYQKVILAAYNKGNACKKAPKIMTADLPLPPSPPDLSLSAKGKADVEFTKNKGMYSPKQWWGLVCKNIDKLYYEKIGSTEPATTQKQIKLWSNIFNVTVKDIHQDELRLKGQKAMSKSRIKDNIKKNCPNTIEEQPVEEQPVEEPTVEEPPVQEPAQIPLSAKKIADDNFKTGGYKKRDWWRLVCQTIDQKYYQFTGSFKSATTESEKQIWLNILRATINDIHQDTIANKNVMFKKTIKRNILKACP